MGVTSTCADCGEPIVMVAGWPVGRHNCQANRIAWLERENKELREAGEQLLGAMDAPSGTPHIRWFQAVADFRAALKGAK